MVEEQNRLLIDYAEKKIRLLGDAIQLYHSRNHMDRTGNLLDSLCWGVSYDGKLVKGNFYRPQSASGSAYLHEFMSGDVKYLIPVYGHQLAERYIVKYGNNGAKGWKVFFAILAPYWGYWEKGFNMKIKDNPWSKDGSALYRFKQFAVMSEFYDVVSKELKPARTRLRVSVAKYDRVKLERKWNKFAGI